MLHLLEEMKGIGENPMDPEERIEMEKLRKEHEKLKKLVSGHEEEKKGGNESSEDSEVKAVSFKIIRSTKM